MDLNKNRRQAVLAWLSVGLLAVLCGILAVLQYRWIGEVSRAERDRLQRVLQMSLYRLSEDFNAEINAACAALAPDSAEIDQAGLEAAYAARYAQWRSSGGRDRLFRRVSIALPQGDVLILRDLDLNSGGFRPGEWPPDWSALRERLTARRFGAAPPSGPFGPAGPGPFARDTVDAIELPRFGPPQPGVRPGPAEQEWLIVALDLDYLRATVFPELLHQHLAAGGRLDYQAEVTTRADTPALLYSTGQTARIGAAADSAVTLMEVRYEQLRRRPPGVRPPSGPADSGHGRWQLRVRHHAGSLEAVVEQARRRHLGVSAVLLVLMLATIAALVQFTRQAQRLAALQVDFVAGVSHELRTPLAVIGTAAYNLQGRVARNPSQVERYGALIQRECEKLTAIVEQVLRFASAKAGRVIRERELLSVATIIEEGVQSSRGVLEGAHCVVDKRVEPGLPMIRGDAMALKHALQNLLQNAVKYGTESSNWIGVSASASRDRTGQVVEIRVADRGPGIPPEEREHIFDPFFRGRQAAEDQVHGTGLGLSLVKQIVEAHGGTVRVESEPAKGAEFVVRIPAAPEEQWDELTHSSR